MHIKIIRVATTEFAIHHRLSLYIPMSAHLLISTKPNRKTAISQRTKNSQKYTETKEKHILL